jgi:protein phosphatase 2C family protein 2/3
MSKISNKPQG